MNLQQITSAFVSAVNPMVPVTLSISMGTYTTNADFSKTPNYTIVTGVMAQVQSLQYRDLLQADGMNLSGTRRSIYLTGDVEGIVRVSGKGGDLITTPNGNVWLVAFVAESWLNDSGNDSPVGWCRVVATLQNGS